MGEIKGYSAEISMYQAQELHEALGEIELLDGLPGFNEAELNKARTVLEHGIRFKQVSECVKVDERVRQICYPSVQNTKVSPLKSITSQDLATLTVNLKNATQERTDWKEPILRKLPNFPERQSWKVQPDLNISEELCPPERGNNRRNILLNNRLPDSYLSISLLVSQELSGATAISSSVITRACPWDEMHYWGERQYFLPTK